MFFPKHSKPNYLQTNKLDREVFVRPPDDIKKEGKIWKLLKPFYGLDDASRKFYLKVKEMLGIRIKNIARR